MFENGFPALKRGTSYAPVCTGLQLNTFEMEVNELVLIDTLDQNVIVEEEPAIAFCDKINKCGHACRGVANERKCLPCLHVDCSEAAGHFENVNEEELCTICYTSELGAEACSQLSCGHVFHTNCVIQLLKHKWATLRITFSFMSCPSCKQEIDIMNLSKPIARELGPLLSLKKKVEKEALLNAERQGILNDERLITPNDVYYGKPQEFANSRCSFYQCNSC